MPKMKITAPLSKILPLIKVRVYPKAPFGSGKDGDPGAAEAHERFLRSCDLGHTQLFCKCQECSLEFFILTWRNHQEAVAGYGSGEPKGTPDMAADCKLFCPECGTRGKVWILGTRLEPGSIYGFVGRQLRPAVGSVDDPTKGSGGFVIEPL